jgi:hypothetical protein
MSSWAIFTRRGTIKARAISYSFLLRRRQRLTEVFAAADASAVYFDTTHGQLDSLTTQAQPLIFIRAHPRLAPRTQLILLRLQGLGQILCRTASGETIAVESRVVRPL